MNMTSDIYIQQNSQSQSGIINRQWVYDQTIPCKIEPMKSGGALNRADNKAFESQGNNEYTERFQLKMKSPVQLSRRSRISNIRDNSGSIIYVEFDIYDKIMEITNVNLFVRFAVKASGRILIFSAGIVAFAARRQPEAGKEECP